MAQSIKMPALGESVTEGTVSAWLKSVGDSVEADEAIVEVATDKVDSEVPSPVEGYLAEILVEEDDVVEVGTVIAKISSAPAQSSTQSAPAAPASTPKPATPPTPAPAPSAPSVPTRPTPPPGPPRPVAPPMPPTPPVAPPRPAPAAPPAPPVAPAAPPAPPVAPASTPTADPQAAVEAAVTRAATTGTQVASAPPLPPAAGYVTPIVRKFAKEKGVDLATVEGSGVGGRIRKEDVIAAAEATAAAALAAETAAASAATVSTQAPAVSGTIEISPEAAALRGTTEKMSRLRQTIAKRMVDSLQSSAQLTTVFEVDVTRIANLRAQYKGQFEKVHGTRLTFLPFFVKAATEALAAHPQLNAIIEGNKVTYFDHENIGIAVDAPKGLMVPVIKNAGEMSIAQIAESINTLAADVRGGTIGPDQLTGSTFTITNTGSGGALFDTPVLNMPEVGIMGVGTIVRRPVVVKDIGGGESIAIRSMVYLSITYDHRLVDGADAARFLTSVKKRLEEANFLPDLQLD